MKMKKIIFTVTVIALVAAFGVSAFLVGNYLLEGKRQEQIYENMFTTTEATTAPETTTETPTTEATVPETTVDTTPTEPQIIEELKTAYAENPDTVGRLVVPGTKVDYAVMQTPDDRDYYIDKDFYGKANGAGTLYTEICNIHDDPSDNITIYGHNMTNGSMFGELDKYTQKSFWEQNQLVVFNTLYEYRTYQIFAVFKTSGLVDEIFPYHKFVDAENAAEFDEFIRGCKGNPSEGIAYSFYETGITPVYGDEILCLSTCEYSMGGGNGRLVVCAVRMDS